jgi:MYXO-CTERM domain-containing protein
MRGRIVRAISWVVVPLVVVLTLGQIYLSALNRAGDAPGAAGIVVSTLPDLLALGLLALGLLVAHRRPANPVGWIIAGTVVTVGISDFVESYAVYALYTDPGSLPGGETMALVSNWIFIPALFAAPSMLFLLFPDGKLVSRRWIPVFWIVILTTCAAITTSIFQPVLNDPPFEGVVNPLGFSPPQALLAPLSYIGWPGMAASFLVAAFAMILRLRRSHGVERQQLKWIAAAAAVLPLASVSGVVLYYLGYDAIAGFLAIFSIVPIFLAAGYAILRYRLYDIDLIINRTLVYGALTVMLAAVYFASVVGLQRLLSPLTGESNQLATVASTLLIAALFTPLRQRIQGFIDRRFYRSKYDAVTTLEAFSARLRNETDLDTLGSGLVSVVRETMQPEHVSLWLRSQGDRVER